MRPEIIAVLCATDLHCRIGPGSAGRLGRHTEVDPAIPAVIGQAQPDTRCCTSFVSTHTHGHVTRQQTLCQSPCGCDCLANCYQVVSTWRLLLLLLLPTLCRAGDHQCMLTHTSGAAGAPTGCKEVCAGACTVNCEHWQRLTATTPCCLLHAALSMLTFPSRCMLHHRSPELKCPTPAHTNTHKCCSQPPFEAKACMHLRPHGTVLASCWRCCHCEEPQLAHPTQLMPLLSVHAGGLNPAECASMRAAVASDARHSCAVPSAAYTV